MLALAVLAAGQTPEPLTAKQQEALRTGVEAVVYGLPLVIMDLTKQASTNVIQPMRGAAPVNQFGNMEAFPTAAFKQVVRANVDTLYSPAFLDLSQEPLVLSVPNTHGRYFLLPMFDAWTNVFGSPGTRTTGNQGGNYLIVGPNWSGPLPGNMPVYKSSSNMVWILGRTQTNGPADYPAVHAIQAGYKLTPLSQFGKSYTPPLGLRNPNFDYKTPPVQKMMAMSSATYFTELAQLLKSNPPPPADAPLMSKFASIGIVPGQPFDPSHLDPDVARALEQSVSIALQKLHQGAGELGKPVNGWLIPSNVVGQSPTTGPGRSSR